MNEYFAIGADGLIAGRCASASKARQHAGTFTFPAKGSTAEIYAAAGQYLDATRPALRAPMIVTKPRSGTQNQQWEVRANDTVAWVDPNYGHTVQVPPSW